MSIARTIAAWAAATATTAGPVEEATQAEVDAGTEANNAVLSDALHAADNLPGALIDTQVFTGNGTWTKPSGARIIEVECLGGGGGGAGADTTSTSNWRMGAGGSGGGYGRGLFLASGWGATVAVVVGALGGFGASANGNGAAGGDSTFNGTSSPYVSGNGGGGGQGAGSDNTVGGTSAGGTAVVVGEIADTDLIIYGSSGGFGCIGAPVKTTPNGGAGGGRFAGAITQGDITTTTAGASIGRTAGTKDWGAGGCGGMSYKTASTAQGGNGCEGMVVVKSYS
jgi:hypothetical protein